jgi:hypothetical protein
LAREELPEEVCPVQNERQRREERKKPPRSLPFQGVRVDVSGQNLRSAVHGLWPPRCGMGQYEDRGFLDALSFLDVAAAAAAASPTQLVVEGGHHAHDMDMAIDIVDDSTTKRDSILAFESAAEHDANAWSPW